MSFLPRTWHRHPLLRLAVSLAIACATLVLVMVLFESSLIYFPSRFPDGFWDLEAIAERTGLEIEDCSFDAVDGVRLHGWWCETAASAERQPPMVLLFFHGNAGNLSHRAPMLVRLADLPCQVLIIDYRGYGRSEGRPSEQGLYRDGDAAWRYLIEDRDVDPARVVVFGKSLGGAVAVDLASRVEPAGLIVQSSFTSVPDMARHHYPFVPGFLIRTRMDSAAKIGAVECPKLFVHSPDDEIVPFTLGRRLYEAASEPKRLYLVEGAGHNETDLVGGAAYYQALGGFIASCAGRARGEEQLP